MQIGVGKGATMVPILTIISSVSFLSTASNTELDLSLSETNAFITCVCFRNIC